MKKILAVTLAALLAFALVHSLFAYVMWDFNPGNWPEKARFSIAVFGVPLAALSAIYTYLLIERVEHETT